MKVKGINPVERHVEKLVLAVFALFVLAVLLMQTGLVGGGRTVKVGAADLPLDGALAAVKDVALQRQSRLQSDQVAPGIPPSLPDPAGVFDAALAASTRTPSPLTSLGQSALRLGTDNPDLGLANLPKGGDVRYAELVVPKPMSLIATAFEGTIDPIEVAEIGAPLASLLPPAQPFDARVPCVEATFDAESLRKSIESPIGVGVSALPPAFWQGKVELVDVEWTRSELASGGQWTEETIIATLPGRTTPRDIIAKPDFKPSDFRETLERERVERLNIRRPQFYTTISGSPWVWPSAVKKEAEVLGGEDVARLKRELASVRVEIADLRERLARLGQPPRKPGDNPPAPPKGPGGGGGGGGDRGPSADATRRSNPLEAPTNPNYQWPEFQKHWYAQIGGGGGGGPPEKSGDTTEQRRREREAQAKKAIEDKIDRLVKREQELLAELEAKGVGAQAAIVPTFFDEPLGSLASGEMKQITLWTHDLTAKPGATYRYRARVSVTNPFYGQTDWLRDDQKNLANAPIIKGEVSDWSEPVSVAPSVVYFITSASEAGGPLAATARAAAELYEFFYGYWRRTTVSMTPGDSLAGSLELPELQTFELERLAGVAAKFAVKDRPALDRTRSVSTGIFLLDTASVVSGPAGTAQAFLRHAEGSVLARRPASDGPDALERVHYQASANAAATAIVREPGLGTPAAPPGGQGPRGPQAPGNNPGAPPPPPPKQNPGGPPTLPGREKL